MIALSPCGAGRDAPHVPANHARHRCPLVSWLGELSRAVRGAVLLLATAVSGVASACRGGTGLPAWLAHEVAAVEEWR